jgi:hypothetical protein
LDSKRRQEHGWITREAGDRGRKDRVRFEKRRRQDVQLGVTLQQMVATPVA